MPPVVVATSPRGARDILGRTGAHIEKTRIHHEMRHLLGPNLFDLTHEPWKPRRRTLQPVFTKQRVSEFGGHMAQAAQAVHEKWGEGGVVDLDAECRALTLRALGRSVLGLDLEQRADEVAEPLRIALTYAIHRATGLAAGTRLVPDTGTPAGTGGKRAIACSDSGDSA